MTPEVASPSPTTDDRPPTPPAQPTTPITSATDVSTENHMIWAVTSTIAAYVVCCFSCFAFPACASGIVAIVYASQVNSKLAAEDFAGAAAAQRNAKIWCWVTTAFVILGIISFLAIIALGGFGAYLEEMEKLRGSAGV
ncbi:MAG: CD225/dispanin family protein [Xanthomonadales bacterium]|nr:CD225/dispanin family protein [Xanthomonadales bacterium]